MRKIRLVILGVFILSVAAYVIVRMTRPPLSDEEQIKALILKASRAVEEHRVGTFMSLVSDDYYDGVYFKQDLTNLARAGLRPGRELQVTVFLRSLQVQGQSATTEMDTDIIARPGEETGHYHIVAEWRKGPRGWQVIRARGWEGAQEL
jgi:hypothetical protein